MAEVGPGFPKMFMLMALFDSEIRDEIFTLMELSELRNYTHFVGLHGSSDSGKKEGTVSWPGANEIMMLVLSEPQKEEFKRTIDSYKGERENSPPLLTFYWPLTEVM